MFEEMVNNLRHSDSFRFGTVVREDPMAEDGSREGADIVDRNMSAVVQQRAGFAPEDEELPRAETSSPVHIVIHKSA